MKRFSNHSQNKILYSDEISWYHSFQTKESMREWEKL